MMKAFLNSSFCVQNKVNTIFTSFSNPTNFSKGRIIKEVLTLPSKIGFC